MKKVDKQNMYYTIFILKNITPNPPRQVHVWYGLDRLGG